MGWAWSTSRLVGSAWRVWDWNQEKSNDYGGRTSQKKSRRVWISVELGRSFLQRWAQFWREIREVRLQGHWWHFAWETTIGWKIETQKSNYERYFHCWEKYRCESLDFKGLYQDNGRSRGRLELGKRSETSNICDHCISFILERDLIPR